MYVKKLLYIAILLYAPLTKLCSQSYINSIEHGVYIDHKLTYPYNQVVVTTSPGIFFEVSMLDIPGDIDLHFNSTVQSRAGSLAYLINNMKEPAGYRGSPNHRVYYSIGYMTSFNKFRHGFQIGTGTRGSVFKSSQYYRVIDSNGAFLDLGVHLQIGNKYNFLFFGYSYGLKLDNGS